MHTTSEFLHSQLKQFFGFDSFKGQQEEVIQTQVHRKLIQAELFQKFWID